jgi:hypothetical protein
MTQLQNLDSQEPIRNNKYSEYVKMKPSIVVLSSLASITPLAKVYSAPAAPLPYSHGKVRLKFSGNHGTPGSKGEKPFSSTIASSGHSTSSCIRAEHELH